MKVDNRPEARHTDGMTTDAFSSAPLVDDPSLPLPSDFDSGLCRHGVPDIQWCGPCYMEHAVPEDPRCPTCGDFLRQTSGRGALAGGLWGCVTCETLA